MNQEDYDELSQEDRYESCGGKDSGYCQCGAELKTTSEQEIGVCNECR